MKLHKHALSRVSFLMLVLLASKIAVAQEFPVGNDRRDPAVQPQLAYEVPEYIRDYVLRLEQAATTQSLNMQKSLEMLEKLRSLARTRKEDSRRIKLLRIKTSLALELKRVCDLKIANSLGDFGALLDQSLSAGSLAGKTALELAEGNHERSAILIWVRDLARIQERELRIRSSLGECSVQSVLLAQLRLIDAELAVARIESMEPSEDVKGHR